MDRLEGIKARLAEMEAEVARQHHAEHGDMDGDVCMLARCAIHYPDAAAERRVRELEAEVKERVTW